MMLFYLKIKENIYTYPYEILSFHQFFDGVSYIQQKIDEIELLRDEVIKKSIIFVPNLREVFLRYNEQKLNLEYYMSYVGDWNHESDIYYYLRRLSCTNFNTGREWSHPVFCLNDKKNNIFHKEKICLNDFHRTNSINSKTAYI